MSDDGPWAAVFKRLEQSAYDTATEVLAMHDGAEASTTRTPNGTFNHMEWLGAELRDTRDELKRLEKYIVVIDDE